MPNFFQVDGDAINGQAPGDALEVGGGTLISFEQSVGRTGVGTLIDIEQDVVFIEIASGLLIEIEQDVESLGVGTLIDIEQNVQDAAVITPVDRRGWDVVLVIDGSVINPCQIHGRIEIDRTESTASLMTVTLIPPIGMQDVNFFQGKSIFVDGITEAGTQRLYTGIIDIPEFDLIQQTVTLRCTDKRTELINDQLQGIVGSIGFYSDIIFGQGSQTIADELEDRLSTIPFAADFDAYGVFNLTPWAAKLTPDFTLDDCDVYRRAPRVELLNRGRITNKVNVGFQYRYNRLHHTERNFSWTSPIEDDPCNLLQFGFSLTSRNAVRTAVEAAGWPLRGEIDFLPILPAGWYNCAGTSIAWATTRLIGKNTCVKDEQGDPVLGSDGKPLYETELVGGTDFAPLYTNGASWIGTFRWAQTITESYNFSVSAPQSISQYGTVEVNQNYAAQADTDVSGWEEYTAYTNTGNGTGNYFINQDVNRAAFQNAYNTAAQKARTTILGSHRDTFVTIQRSLWPEIDLKHTVELTTNRLNAKGKVYSIKHMIDGNTNEAVTEVTLVLSKSLGSATDTPITIPPLPAESVNPGTGTIFLGNHFGEDPSQPGAELWNGMIGNRYITVPIGGLATNTFRTNYPEAFIVDTPAIPSSVRDEKTLAASTSYDLEIPDDLLEVIFPDD